MGHGGYVAGLFASRTKGAVQVTLRRPTPLETPLEIEILDDDRQHVVLRRLDVADPAEAVVAESEARPLEVDVPTPPPVDQAAATEPDSPSFYNGTGLHPTCFGCAVDRPGEPGLGIAAGPVTAGGVRQVAARWVPPAIFAGPDGTLDSQWVLAALDCPGSFAFVAYGTPAGLLGRIAFEQLSPVRAGEPHVVTGWQIGVDGRKLFAGTALFTAGGELLAAARATWFGM